MKPYQRFIVVAAFTLCAVRFAYEMATTNAAYKSPFAIQIFIILALLYYFLKGSKFTAFLAMLYAFVTGCMNIFLGLMLLAKGGATGLAVAAWGLVFIYVAKLIYGTIKGPGRRKA